MPRWKSVSRNSSRGSASEIGEATPEELKILDAAIDVAWGEGGFKTFGKKKEMVDGHLTLSH